MDDREKYRHWEDIAKYDLETARAMLNSGRYLYVVFMCQQAIEKLVKGLYVLFSGKEPPRTHNIWNVFKSIFNNTVYRTKILDDLFDEKKEAYKPFLIELVAYYITGRYPSYKDELSKVIDKKKAEGILEKAEEVFSWLQFLSQYNG